MKSTQMGEIAPQTAQLPWGADLSGPQASRGERAGIFGGRWKVNSLVAQGGMSLVYEVTDLRDGGLCALKVLREELREETRAIRRLRNEAVAMLLMLDHPHIVHLVDVGIDPMEGLTYVAMEWASGGSAADQVRAFGPVCADQAATWMLQVLAGLAAAHERRIVHRDVKPSNILLGSARRVLLADFGIARVLDEVSPPQALLGSKSYMSPEQRRDPANVGPAADIYAAGCTLFQLVTGEGPVGLWKATPSDERWDRVPSELVAVIQTAVAREPQARFASAREMALALVPSVHAALLEQHPHLGRWLDETPAIKKAHTARSPA